MLLPLHHRWTPAAVAPAEERDQRARVDAGVVLEHSLDLGRRVDDVAEGALDAELAELRRDLDPRRDQTSAAARDA